MSFRFQALTQPKLTQPNEPKKLHIIFFSGKRNSCRVKSGKIYITFSSLTISHI